MRSNNANHRYKVNLSHIKAVGQAMNYLVPILRFLYVKSVTTITKDVIISPLNAKKGFILSILCYFYYGPYERRIGPKKNRIQYQRNLKSVSARCLNFQLRDWSNLQITH